MNRTLLLATTAIVASNALRFEQKEANMAEAEWGWSFDWRAAAREAERAVKRAAEAADRAAREAAEVADRIAREAAEAAERIAREAAEAAEAARVEAAEAADRAAREVAERAESLLQGDLDFIHADLEEFTDEQVANIRAVAGEIREVFEAMEGATGAWLDEYCMDI